MAISSHQRTRLVCSGAILTETTRGVRSVRVRVTEISTEGCTFHVQTQMWAGDSGRMRADTFGEVWFPIVVTRVRRATHGGWTVNVEFDRLTHAKRQLVDQLVLRENSRRLEQFATKRLAPMP